MGQHQSDQPRRTPSIAAGDPAALADALVRAGSGDREAFAAVYRMTSVKLFGVCLRISPERAEAEEALQEAFLTIWRRAHLFDRGRGTAMTWLITVTRNRAVDRLRASGRLPTAPIDAGLDVPDGGLDARAMLEVNEEQRRLLICLAELSGGDAGLIRAGFLEGSTYPVLAERAGLPLGTIKSRIRRALLKLRACLQ